jgi:tripartite-type tricarboxylate transporter receptor subunit TctC
MNERWRQLAAASFFFLPMLGGSAAQAQSYPTHPVRLISDSAAGSAVDVSLRIIANGLTRMWGQQAAVINQPGAGGAIAAHAAAAAAPDGYTLFMPAFSAFGALPGVADNLRSCCRAISSRWAAWAVLPCSSPQLTGST